MLRHQVSQDFAGPCNVENLVSQVLHAVCLLQYDGQCYLERGGVGRPPARVHTAEMCNSLIDRGFCTADASAAWPGGM